MKILFYNINRGRNNLSGVVDYISELSNIIDIFCFQEIEGEVLEKIDSLLLDKNFHKKYNKHCIINNLKHDGFDNCVYLSDKFNEVSYSEVVDKESVIPPIIWVSFLYGNSKWNILNFHGLPEPGNKLDTTERLLSSEKIIQIAKSMTGKIVIGGDFNLLPETQSVKMFENADFKNLISDFKIDTTRNENAWRLYPNNKQLYADFCFTSQNCKINSFEVPKNLYSDHLPLILDID